MSDMLAQALAYAQCGWHVFPIKPKDKTPATAHGFKDATTDPQAILQWWSVHPYNVGIATGSVSGLLVLDLDTKYGAGIDELLSPYGGVRALPETPCVQTGSGGVHYYFVYPAGSGLTISGGKLGKGIDTRGDGGYVVAPPSLHPNGKAYQWFEFEGHDPAACPLWIVEGLTRQAERKPGKIGAGKLTGGRHQTMMTAAAFMRNNGFEAPEIEAALHKLKLRFDLTDGRVIEDKEIEDISRWAADRDTGIVTLDSVAHGHAVAEQFLAMSSPALHEALGANEPENPGPFPKELLDVPGILGDTIECIEAGAKISQPVLALGAAVSLMGVLIGRKYETENGIRSNVYCLSVCESGGGKERARSVVKQLLMLSGGEEFLGPEDVASDAGIVETLSQNPVSIMLLDEIGRILKTMNNPQSSPHLYNVTTLFLRLFSNARSSYIGKAYADRKNNRKIIQPHCVIYGTTVPKSLWEGLTVEALTDGFLARMLIWVSDATPPPRRAGLDLSMPPDLVAAVRDWVTMDNPGGNLSMAFPVASTVPRTAEGRDTLYALEDRAIAERERLGNAGVGTLWTRTVEKAEQLALIYACSRSRSAPQIDREAASWAADVAEYLTRRMAYEAAQNMARNARETESNRILKDVEMTGDEGLTRTDLLRRYRHLRSQDLSDHLSHLADAGLIHSIQVTKGNRTYHVYKSGLGGKEGNKEQAA